MRVDYHPYEGRKVKGKATVVMSRGEVIVDDGKFVGRKGHQARFAHTANMNEQILVAVRHSCWANAALIEFCKGLSAEQLGWSVPGTYGTIERTLRHIVSADQGYLLALTGEIPGEPRANPDVDVPLDELASKVRAVRERCERVLSEPFDVARTITRPRAIASAGVVLAQLVHHGSDHRAHVGTILGAHGVEPPDLDVWAYGTTIGQVTAG